MTGKIHTHAEAIDALCGCAATVTVLSYQEAIEGYFKLRDLPIPADHPTAVDAALGGDHVAQPREMVPPMTQQDVAAAVVRIAEISGDRAAPGFNETGRLARINQIANELLSALQQRSGAVERELVIAVFLAGADEALARISKAAQAGDAAGMALALRIEAGLYADAILGGQSCP